MTDTTQLDALRALEKMVAAGGMWSEANLRVAFAQRSRLAGRALNGSIDAALALFDAVLPEWTATIGQNMHHKHWVASATFIQPDGAATDWLATDTNNPSSALLLAIIRALIWTLEKEGA